MSLFHRTDSLVQQALNCCSTNSASTRGRLMEMIGHFISSLALGTVCTTVMYRWEQSPWNNRNPRRRHYTRKRWSSIYWSSILAPSTADSSLANRQTVINVCKDTRETMYIKNGLFVKCWLTVLNVLDWVTLSQNDIHKGLCLGSTSLSQALCSHSNAQGGIHEEQIVPQNSIVYV